MVAATTIVNAKVFDGTKSQDWTSVRFVDGLITECSVASAAQEGDEVIDAAGGTVFPGLIDAHVHLVPGALAQSLTFGVTTVLDMFSKPDLVARAKEQAGSRPDVADVRSSGVGATAPGGHPSMMYAPFPTLTAADQAEQFVADRIAAGSDYLKIISGAGGRWPSLDSATIKALVSAAHARGLVVVAHVSSTAGVEEVVSAGVDVVAHVPAAAELDKALVERMAEAGIVVGPTLATIENTLGEPGGAAVAGDPRLAAALGDVWVRRLTSGASGWRGRELPPYSRAEDNVRRLADAGVALLAGTDAPNPGTVFGASLHRELELLVRCGISPAQALAAATAEPARVFGLADRGRIAAGQRADLVLVSGDPLTDITATRAIERIWRSGTACDRRAFVASAAEAEQLDAFDAQVAKSWQPCANASAASTQERPPDVKPRKGPPELQPKAGPTNAGLVAHGRPSCGRRRLLRLRRDAEVISLDLSIRAPVNRATFPVRGLRNVRHMRFEEWWATRSVDVARRCGGCAHTMVDERLGWVAVSKRAKTSRGRGGAADGEKRQKIRDIFVGRPFEGLAAETEWIALRELVPAASAPLTLAPDLVERYGPREVTLATVLPMAWPAMTKPDGRVLIGLQRHVQSGDVSRDLAVALLCALETPTGQTVGVPALPGVGPRLQDVLVDGPLDITVHSGFEFWLEQDATDDPAVRASLERANASVFPTTKLGAADAAYWCRVTDRSHVRLVLPDNEDQAMDALSRLSAGGELLLGENTKFAGMFRAHGLLAPVWDLPFEPEAEVWEAPVAEFAKRYAEALAVDEPLTPAERRSRQGLIGRLQPLR